MALTRRRRPTAVGSQRPRSDDQRQIALGQVRSPHLLRL